LKRGATEVAHLNSDALSCGGWALLVVKVHFLGVYVLNKLIPRALAHTTVVVVIIIAITAVKSNYLKQKNQILTQRILVGNTKLQNM
jgi:hypothetical protein